jgi:threonine synthase
VSGMRGGPAFDAGVDRGVPAEESIIRRYRALLAPELARSVPGLGPEHLASASLREGARVLAPLEHEGVSIALLDETSLMASGTFKSLDACVSAAACLARGERELVFESGGNTGAALSLYAARAGLRTLLVVPAANLPGLPGRAFRAPENRIVAVTGEGRAKAAAERARALLGAAGAPRLEWRYAAGMARGCRVLEHLASGGRADWVSQTVSAAFGPVGLYRALRRWGSGAPPRFLAVQQEENAPFHRRLKGLPSAPRAARELLVPAMYDRDPFSHGSFEEFSRLMAEGGESLTVSRSEFAAFAGPDGPGVEAALAARGLRLAGGAAGAADKAGLVGLAGVFKAIAAGLIRPGETVLHAMTSGALDKGAPPLPDLVVAGPEELDAAGLEGLLRGAAV